MEPIQLAALLVMAVFYIAYFTKMLLQRRKGIRTDQMGRGSKPKKLLVTETLLKISTYSVVPVEVVSIVGGFRLWASPTGWAGIGIAALGVAVFVIAMCTMKDSWRAGISEKDTTKLITTGIYRFSRNPAFLGFDLMYVGLLLSFFNLVHLAFAVFSMVMLHLQILQEEGYLREAFGETYAQYYSCTGRYFSLPKCKKWSNKKHPEE